jgi:hypothetical protein
MTTLTTPISEATIRLLKMDDSVHTSIMLAAGQGITS